MSTPEASTRPERLTGDEMTRVITALHHPLRRALVTRLFLDGPATVSGLADATGERVGNVSHHIKVLAEAGLVTEVPALAKDRREHWWRAVPRPISWSYADVMGDPVAETVVSAAEQQNLAHHVGKVQDWYAHRESFDEEWVRAAASTDGWLAVTPTELDEFTAKITALLVSYGATPERCADSARQLVFAFAHAVPAQP
jgi:DNA-binding transcriptional ArsR family regulator